MKFRITEIFLGVFLTIAVFAIGFVVASSMPPPSQQIEKAGHPQAANESAERTAEKQIAYYTKWLAWFTGALVVASGIQGYFLLRADKTARISADAAKRSADGLLDAERPHMILSELKISGLKGTPGPDGMIILSEHVRIINHGRSPAILKSLANNVFISDDDLPPIFDFGKPIPTRWVIAPDRDFGNMAGPEKIPVPVDKVKKIINNEERVWAFIAVTYEDTFRRPHQMKAAYRVIFDGGDASTHFFPDGPEFYWEYT